MKVKEARKLIDQVRTKIKGKKDAQFMDKQIETSIRKFMDQNRLQRPLRKTEFDISSASLSTIKPEVLRKADDLYILSVILNRDPQELKLWKTYDADMSELRKAMDTQTTAEGYEWIPTGFSRELIERVKLELKVAALFNRITMPTSTYVLPAQGADAVAYRTPESLVDSSTKITASTPRTRRVTFNAVKLASRIVFSEEMTEDSLIPVLPYIKERLVEALVVAEEQAVINGDVLPAPHQDNDVVNLMDARWAWNGLRWWARNCGTVEVDLGTFNTQNLRAIRRAMGIYGADPAKLAWVTSICGYFALMSNTDVLTVDKYGPQATILKGELGKFDNVPIVVSEYVRSDLDANGLYSGPGNTRTILILVYRNGFMFGDRRKVTLKTKEDIEVDQTIGVATQRLDFQGLYACATETPVGVGRNVGPC